jgi:hypothetical protein
VKNWDMDWDLVKQLEQEIIRFAQIHQRPEEGFGWEVVAALMSAHVAREKRNALATYDALTDTLPGNRSTGIANLRPSVIDEILRGDLVIPGRPYIPEEFEYELMYRDCFLNGALEDLSHTRSLLQDNAISLDFLGANIERGIDRAKNVSPPLKPSIFNVDNFLWNGVQQPSRMWYGVFYHEPITSQKRGFAHGLAMVDSIGVAAEVLGVTLPYYLPYNTTSDPRTDESVFVECRIQSVTTRGGVLYVQTPPCVPKVMNINEFESIYGSYRNTIKP